MREVVKDKYPFHAINPYKKTKVSKNDGAKTRRGSQRSANPYWAVRIGVVIEISGRSEELGVRREVRTCRGFNPSHLTLHASPKHYIVFAALANLAAASFALILSLFQNCVITS